jgi:hypothetical protein
VVESQRLEPTERNVTVPSVTISDSSLFPVSRSSNLLPWFEGEYPPEKSGHRVVQTRKSPIPPMPPRITKESHRPRVSDRTMSYRLSERITVTLVLVSRNAWRRHHSKTTAGRNSLTVSCDETKQRLPEEDHSSIARARSNDGAECRDKKVSAPSRRQVLSLDISFFRTCPVSAAFTSRFPRSVVLSLVRNS